MKNLKLIPMLLLIVFSACRQDGVDELSNDFNDDASSGNIQALEIGPIHNEIMEAGLVALINRKSDNYKDFYENELYPDVIVGFTSQKTGIAIDDVKTYLSVLGYTGIFEDDLDLEPVEMDEANSNFMSDIKGLLGKNLTSAEFANELDKLEVKYANEIDTDVLKSYSSVAIHSFDYWNTNSLDWVNNSIQTGGNDVITANRIDVGEVIAADISGAIGGAIGGAILGGAGALPGAMVGAEVGSILNIIKQIVFP